MVVVVAFASIKLREDLIERVLLAVIRTLDGYDPPPLAFQSRDLEMDDEVHNLRAVDTNARPNHINSAAVFVVGDDPTVRNVSVVIDLILTLPCCRSITPRMAASVVSQSFTPKGHSSTLGCCNTEK
jgi:hypothetical protein